MPSKAETIDRLLLLIAAPERAEEVAGDLLEQYLSVKARQPGWFADLWFWKEFLIVWISMAWGRFEKAIRLVGAVEVIRRWLGG
jgi:hypothetical protein